MKRPEGEKTERKASTGSKSSSLGNETSSKSGAEETERLADMIRVEAHEHSLEVERTKALEKLSDIGLKYRAGDIVDDYINDGTHWFEVPLLYGETGTLIFNSKEIYYLCPHSNSEKPVEELSDIDAIYKKTMRNLKILSRIFISFVVAGLFLAVLSVAFGYPTSGVIFFFVAVLMGSFSFSFRIDFKEMEALDPSLRKEIIKA